MTPVQTPLTIETSEESGSSEYVRPGVRGAARPTTMRVAMLSEHAYAEYDVASEDQVIHLPATLAQQPFPAEPLGCAMNIFHRAGIRARQTVAIVGIGFLGALLTRLATNANARVIAIS